MSHATLALLSGVFFALLIWAVCTFETWLIPPPPPKPLGYYTADIPVGTDKLELFDMEKDTEDLITFYAECFGLDPRLLKAVIKVESNFNRNAHRHEPWVSHLGGPDCSFGLMQLLESTARGLGHTGAARDLYHPATNIYFGAKYLRQQLDRYGNVAKAIAAYNAGSVRYAADGTDRFCNQIYVDKVAEAMEEN